MASPTSPGTEPEAGGPASRVGRVACSLAAAATNLFGGPYRYVTPLPFVERHFAHGHLDNAAAAELLSIARNDYFDEAIGWPGIGADTIWTSVRRVVIEYESEAWGDESLLGGVRAVRRTQRTVHLDQAIWTAASGREVVRGQTVVVTYDVRLRRAIPLPAEFWRLIDEFDGPLADRP